MRRSAVIQFVRDLHDNGMIEIAHVDEQCHRNAVEMLPNRQDKQWSVCDATSFLLMDRYSETEALTTDHHFEQAGFLRLLR